MWGCSFKKGADGSDFGSASLDGLFNQTSDDGSDHPHTTFPRSDASEIQRETHLSAVDHLSEVVEL